MSKSRAFVVALGSAVWVLVWGSVFLDSFGGSDDPPPTTAPPTSTASFLDEWDATRERWTPYSYEPSRPTYEPRSDRYTDPLPTYVPSDPFAGAGSVFR